MSNVHILLALGSAYPAWRVFLLPISQCQNHWDNPWMNQYRLDSHRSFHGLGDHRSPRPSSRWLTSQWISYIVPCVQQTHACTEPHPCTSPGQTSWNKSTFACRLVPPFPWIQVEQENSKNRVITPVLRSFIFLWGCKFKFRKRYSLDNLPIFVFPNM